MYQFLLGVEKNYYIAHHRRYGAHTECALSVRLVHVNGSIFRLRINIAINNIKLTHYVMHVYHISLYPLFPNILNRFYRTIITGSIKCYTQEICGFDCATLIDKWLWTFVNKQHRTKKGKPKFGI